MVSPSELILVSIVVGALALIVSGKLRADIVALLVMLSLTAVGLVTIDEALSGFSRSVIFILLGLVIIVLRTSLIRIAGHWKTSRSQALAQASSERENQRRKKLAGASNVEER